MSNPYNRKGHVFLTLVGIVLTEAVIIVLFLGGHWLVNKATDTVMGKRCTEHSEFKLEIIGEVGKPDSKVLVQQTTDSCK